VSGTLAKIKSLITNGNYSFSDHAYEELAKDDIAPHELTNGIVAAILVEDYPDAKRGPTALVYCQGDDGRPLHAVWGIPKLNQNIAILVTAYRPNYLEWTTDFLRRVAR
jgi:hypothetical protein